MKMTCGETVNLHVLRRGKLWTLAMPVIAAAQDVIWLEVAEEEKLKRWLSAPAGSARDRGAHQTS